MKISSQRYEEIKSSVADLLEDYNIKEVPIDIFKLAKKMNIRIVYSSKLLEKNESKGEQYYHFEYPHSYLYFDSDTQKFLIYIDDIRTKKKRQRFSLAHEIMHIVLGHSEQNKINEDEANFKATYLLAPTSLVVSMPGEEALYKPTAIERIFDVSNEAAQIIVKYNRGRHNLLFLGEKEYEKRINMLLKSSLIEKLESL